MNGTKITRAGERVFRTLSGADAFCDQKEAEGFAHVTVTTNTPAVGLFTATWGNEVPVSYEEGRRALFDAHARMFDEREQEAESRFTRDCEMYGRSSAARQIADASGYTAGTKGRDYFIQGFCGAAIKQANPRANGMEDIFKAGRAAWNSDAGQRAFRIESVRQRAILETPEISPINYAGGD